MLKQEFIKTLKSPKSIISFAVLMCIALGSFLKNILSEEPLTEHPLFLSILTGGVWVSFRNISLWIMPVFVMLGYCEKYAGEYKNGMTNVYVSKVGKRKFFWSKIVSAFIVSDFISGVPVIADTLLNFAVYHGNDGFGSMGRLTKEEMGAYLYNMFEHPYLTWIAFFISYLIVMGLLGVMCQSICFICANNKLSYLICVALWMFNFSTPIICINDAIQPFQVESTAENGLIGYVYYLIMTLVPLLIASVKLKVNKDEI